MPVLDTSGDRDQIDMEKLVDVMNPGHRFEFRELLAFAGSHGLFERLNPQNKNDPKSIG
jgi:hypothetical protein